MVSSAVNDLSTAVYQQRDISLARDGSASFLLITDSMILRNPNDPALLLNGMQLYSAYASAFLIGKDKERAFILLDRAPEYGFDLWEEQFGWKSVNLMSIDDWESIVAKTSLKDVPALYWTASTWASWITTHPDSIVAISDLPFVLTALNRVLELDDMYQNGSVHLFFGMYYAIQPSGIGRDLEKSLFHFQTAIQAAGPYAMLPKVLFARYYARAQFDEELFTKTLREVLLSPSNCPDPNLNLMNAIARERAELYLEQLEELF